MAQIVQKSIVYDNHTVIPTRAPAGGADDSGSVVTPSKSQVNLADTLAAYLPIFVLYLLNAQGLPWVIYFAGIAEKHKQYSAENRALFVKYCVFLFVITVILPSISSVVLSIGNISYLSGRSYEDWQWYDISFVILQD